MNKIIFALLFLTVFSYSAFAREAYTITSVSLNGSSVEISISFQHANATQNQTVAIPLSALIVEKKNQPGVKTVSARVIDAVIFKAIAQKKEFINNSIVANSALQGLQSKIGVPLSFSDQEAEEFFQSRGE